ncbi:hypothetical protein ABZX90_13325 [Streptomyces sp. NPDC002935]|uniref:hypothetical protein n=1 Tax=unclassified Streptomyces TaxID=2593676 RepID=UPI00331AD00B
MNHSSRSARTSAEAERLREVFAEAACDVTPSAVPLGAIEREGRRLRRRRRTTVLGAACGALLVPLAVVGLRDGVASGSAGSVTTPAARGSSTSPSPSAGAVRLRVVAPGERVRVTTGTELWLTKDGMHWTERGMPAQSLSVVDGHLDMNGPGVSFQLSTRGDGRTFLSGVFHGTGEPARVEVTSPAGTVHAAALTLAGKPGWGAWYAVTTVPASPAPHATPTGDPWRVTVYDLAGRAIARQGYRP